MGEAAREAGVAIITGDTKVVERGKADGVFISTAGVGVLPDGLDLSADKARPGDRVLLSGSLGDHGVAIMSKRQNLTFDTEIVSDSAALHGLVAAMVAVAAACELLGLDPLHVANEGKLVAVVAPEQADTVLAAMKAHPLGRDAAQIGEAVADDHRFVQMATSFGGGRIVDWLSGEQLPRIC